jgi:hypothetical protein
MYLTTLPQLADVCCDEYLSGPLAPRMEACVRLAWAVLRCKEASSSSSSSSASPNSAAEKFARLP